MVRVTSITRVRIATRAETQEMEQSLETGADRARKSTLARSLERDFGIIALGPRVRGDERGNDYQQPPACAGTNGGGACASHILRSFPRKRESRNIISQT